MKKTILSFTILVLSICFFSAKSFSQPAPGSSNGTPSVSLIIDLGAAGVITIPTTSPYYAYVVSALTSLNATIVNGVVSFPTNQCYTNAIKALFYSGCINKTSYEKSKKSKSSSCSSGSGGKEDEEDD